MAARSFRLVLSLFVSLSAALPSAAEVVVRLPTSQKTEVSPGPARSPDPLNARSYFGARYYRADLGRFTTVDPVYTWQENLVDPQRWNRYAYVRNNPLRYTDPDGRCIYPGADCAQYLFGAVKGFVNGFSGMATMVNQATNTLLGPFTDFRFGAAPRWEPTNIDQARGEVAFGVASLFALGQAAAVKAGELGTAVGSAQEGGLALRGDVVLAGGRSGEKVKELLGPANSAVRGSGQRVFVTNDRGQVILDITGDRVKPVVPGQGFGPKRPPTKEELDLIEKLHGK